MDTTIVRPEHPLHRATTITTKSFLIPTSHKRASTLLEENSRSDQSGQTFVSELVRWREQCSSLIGLEAK